jgi:hypothetical protein
MIEPILSVKLLFTVSVPLGVAPVPPKMAPELGNHAPHYPGAAYYRAAVAYVTSPGPR